jgi:hypothetical protein
MVHTRHFDSVIFSLLRPGQHFCVIGRAYISVAPLLGRGEDKRNCEDTISWKYTRARYPRPVYVHIKPALSAHSDFFVTIAAIDRLAVARRKRHFGVFTALSACGRKHLAWESVAVTTIPIPLCLPCLSARRTALGFISIAPGLIELLFPSGEAEVSPTISTLNCFVLKAHWMTSSL